MLLWYRDFWDKNVTSFFSICHFSFIEIIQRCWAPIRRQISHRLCSQHFLKTGVSLWIKHSSWTPTIQDMATTVIHNKYPIVLWNKDHVKGVYEREPWICACLNKAQTSPIKLMSSACDVGRNSIVVCILINELHFTRYFNNNQLGIRRGTKTYKS